MNQIKSIYSKYDSEITRLEYKNYNPVSNLELNSENKRTIFKLPLNDEFLSSNIRYYIAGKYIPKDTTKTYGVNDGIMMIDNFVAHLFSKIEVKKHNTIIDEIEEPGIASTVIGAASFPAKSNGDEANSGFNSRMVGGGNFCANGNLGDLGLGFFSDIAAPIYKGGFEITFFRNSDNNVLYRYKDPTVPTSVEGVEGKVEIKTFYLRVPIIEYASESKAKLIAELSTAPYLFHFKKLQCIEQEVIIGSYSLNINIGSNYRNVQDPFWGFVVFQTARKNDQKKNNSKFDHLNVKNISFEVAGKHYPEERLNLDWSSGDFGSAYTMYRDFKRIICQDSSRPYCELQFFKESYPIFSVNMTRQPQSISGQKSNILLRADFENKVPENTFAYVILVSEVTLNYMPLKNIIREEF